MLARISLACMQDGSLREVLQMLSSCHSESSWTSWGRMRSYRLVIARKQGDNAPCFLVVWGVERCIEVEEWALGWLWVGGWSIVVVDGDEVGLLLFVVVEKGEISLSRSETAGAGVAGRAAAPCFV